jgi:asparagine N-glycosylation enzyme membrane subunit Stt3
MTGVGTVIAGPVLIVAITLVLESIQPGYDRVHDTLSRLVWEHLGWLETGCFLLFALVLVILAFHLNLLNIKGKSLRLSVVMVSLMSAGFVTIAIIPTNAPGEPATLTVFIHRFTAGLTCILFPVVCLSIARGLKDDPTSKRIRNFSLISGSIGIVLSIAGMLIIITETPWKGAIERIILANGILWIEIIGIRLMSILPTSNPEIKKINVFSEIHPYNHTDE